MREAKSKSSELRVNWEKCGAFFRATRCCLWLVFNLPITVLRAGVTLLSLKGQSSYGHLSLNERISLNGAMELYSMCWFIQLELNKGKHTGSDTHKEEGSRYRCPPSGTLHSFHVKDSTYCVVMDAATRACSLA